jgi:hypothetical protein
VRDPADAEPARSRVARGAGGAGLLRRVYRRSPLRWARKVAWDHRGLERRDVFLACYPRSGSVWLRFLLVELLAGDASFEKITSLTPYVGRHVRAPALLPSGGRVIKTHEPWRTPYRRAIHLVRDPRAVALSYFGFLQRIQKIVVRPGDDVAASLDRHVDAFLGGRVDAHGTWQSHLFSWRKAAGERADVLLVPYEQLRSDPVGELRRMAGWLGVELDAAAAAQVVERCTIERMRAAEASALAEAPRVFHPSARRTGLRVVNEGSLEAWRERLTPDQQRRISEAFAEGLQLMGYPLA